MCSGHYNRSSFCGETNLNPGLVIRSQGFSGSVPMTFKFLDFFTLGYLSITFLEDIIFL